VYISSFWKGVPCEVIVDSETHSKIKDAWVGVSSHGYPRLCVGGGKSEYLHRLIMQVNGIVDHIDRNTLNCRQSNLREVSPAESALNTGARITPGRTSLYKGVHLNRRKNRYVSQYRGKHLGAFLAAEAAAEAYRRAATGQ